MIKGWFHIALMNAGYEIACELHGRLLQSGLYDASDSISISMVGDLDYQGRFNKYILSRWSKYKLIFSSSDVKGYEWPALRDMRENAEGNCWYIHTKGASNDCRGDVPRNIQSNVRTWRDCMCHFVIGQWRKCSQLIDEGYDAVGPLYAERLNNDHIWNPHFAGNYWWASGEYIRKIPMDFDFSNRNVAETFITKVPGGKFFNMYTAPGNTDYYGFGGGANIFGNYKT